MTMFDWRALRLSIRRLLRNPTTFVSVVLCLALGLGIGVGVFILVNATMLRPIDGVRDPEGVVLLTPRAQELPGSPGATFRRLLTFDELRVLADGLSSVEGLASYTEIEVPIGRGARASRAAAQIVTPRFFETLGLRPALGVLPSEGERGSVVISDRLWRSWQVRGRELQGATLHVAGRPFLVRGVLPAGFHGIWRDHDADVWLSIEDYPLVAADAPGHGLREPGHRWILWIVGRPAEGGQGVDGVRAELSSWSARSDATAPPPLEVSGGLGVRPAKRDDVRKVLGLLGVTALLVLLVATVNASNLLLARGIERQTDSAIAVALGAGRRELLRETFWEIVLIGGAASLGGVCMGFGFTRWLRGVPLGQYLPSFDRLPLDLRVVVFAVVAALVATAAATSVAAVRATVTDPALLLRRGAGSVTRRLFPLKVFAIIQIAMSVVLVVGAVLLVRTYLNLRAADPGFEAQGVLNLRLDLGPELGSEATAGTVWERVLRGAESVPGIRRATAASIVPLVPGGGEGRIAEVRAEGASAADGHWVAWAAVGPHYLATLRISLLDGRDFDWHDRTGRPSVVIVNRVLARALWPSQDAIGERLVMAGEPHEVVGLIEPVKRSTLDETEEPYFYLPLLQHPAKRATLHVRTAGDPGLLGRALRSRLVEQVPELPVPPAIPYPDAAAESFSRQRLVALLVSVFGVLALALAAIGLFAVFHRLVVSRVDELGIRLALGGDPRRLLATSLAEGLRISAIGILTGFGLSLVLARLLEGMLYGIRPSDPSSYAAVGLLFVLVSVLATYLPSRRAMHTNLATVLRASAE